LPEAFDGVFATALAKSPDDRYSTCRELVEAAQAALHGKVFVRRSVHRRRLLLAGVAALIAAAATIGGLLGSRGAPTSTHSAKSRNGGIGAGIACGAGCFWLAHGSEAIRADPGTGRVLHRFPAAAWWLVFADGAVWAATAGDGRVWKIDPAENSITARTKLHG